jgi:hypothetical protein
VPTLRTKRRPRLNRFTPHIIKAIILDGQPGGGNAGGGGGIELANEMQLGKYESFTTAFPPLARRALELHDRGELQVFLGREKKPLRDWELAALRKAAGGWR